MSAEEVIELSVEETQALRAKLGLPPLRGVTPSSSSSAGIGIAAPPPSSNTEDISLSVEETNALRAKLGLPPLRAEGASKKEGSSASAAIHAPPTDARAEDDARKRVEDAAARREAAERLRRFEAEDDGKVRGDESALDFAAKMRSGGGAGGSRDAVSKKKKKKKRLASNHKLSIPGEEDDEALETTTAYTSTNLSGMKVAHAISDFELGTTAVLTLADRSILDVDPESKKVRGFAGGDNELVNVNMEGDSRAAENLKKKRQIELGAGRAGGYAGYDDDEFEEMGGVGSAVGPAGVSGGGNERSRKGFSIGENGMVSETKDEKKSDLFSTFSGSAVSLQSGHANRVASDFLSYDDDGNDESREERMERERAKQMKILDKLRKKDRKKAKKAKKKKRRERSSSDAEEGTENDGTGANDVPGDRESLLKSLEATAVVQEQRKRRRRDGVAGDANGTTVADGPQAEVDEWAKKRKRFDQIMEKGKARTDKAFNMTVAPAQPANGAGGDSDAEAEDDAFLNAALAKARRLKRLKELNSAKKPGNSDVDKSVPLKGEEAVVKAVEKLKEIERENGEPSAENKCGISFEFDEMQEFTRAMRAREDQARRGGPERRGMKATVGTKQAASQKTAESEKNAAAAAEEVECHVDDVDMEELAQEMEDEDNTNNDNDGAAFGSTAESVGVGRGMSGFLSLLKQTGEISQRASKEEMRGRAKDERTYEDYEKLDLKKVVRIDAAAARDGRAHEKDVEFANREIKLEYRDDFGRLLTRKEAYRNMCYQFHGNGSSKKNQERRLKQIEREREEARAASGRMGTLGALKATQRATGKAFVIHKT